jgi:hypothetical protein
MKAKEFERQFEGGVDITTSLDVSKLALNSQRSKPSFELPSAETLTVEFKSDRKRLSDTDLVEALVCLANTEGGELWLGIEDD